MEPELLFNSLIREVGQGLNTAVNNQSQFDINRANNLATQKLQESANESAETRDSLRFAKEIEILKEELKNQRSADSLSHENAKNLMKSELAEKKLLLEDARKNRKIDDAVARQQWIDTMFYKDKEKDREEDKVRNSFMAPMLRGLMHQMFSEDPSMFPGLGLNESDYIEGLDAGFPTIRKGYQDIMTGMGTNKPVPKSNYERQAFEKDILDVYRKLTGDDGGADFLDGGPFDFITGESEKALSHLLELQKIMSGLGISPNKPQY
mgnify:CR=1 FL=1|tara:strand:+ start:3205 stop:3999 length:795 start_codon:yes stop_codon:yes gene_type:complete